MRNEKKTAKRPKVFTSNDMRRLASAGQRLQIHHQLLTSDGVSSPPALRFGLLTSHVPAIASMPKPTWGNLNLKHFTFWCRAETVSNL